MTTSPTVYALWAAYIQHRGLPGWPDEYGTSWKGRSFILSGSFDTRWKGR